MRADEIDLVLLTHLDDDHIGGLLAGSWPEPLELAFGQARVLAPRAGLEAVAAGEGLPVGVEERRRVVALLENAGVVETFEPGDEIAPGVRVRDAPGHRAGHVCVEVAGDPPFVHLADALHHEAHVEHPEWDGPADDDRPLALATRIALLRELADSSARAVASHVAGPAGFTVVAAGSGFEARAAGA